MRNDGAVGEPLLVIQGLTKEFPARSVAGWRSRGRVSTRAVADVSFTVNRGQTLGLIGESGSGKSTAARCILRLIEPSSGSVRLGGEDVTSASHRKLRELRRDMQLVFQTPRGALDPRRTIGVSIAEPLVAHRVGSRASRRAHVRDLLALVGLDPTADRHYPHQFSGGEQQRIVIARAVALEPALVICDEPVSALDVSIQAQILNLLRDLQQELGLTYLFISHDIAVVRVMSDEIAVMKDGMIVELGATEDVCRDPIDPYTERLILASKSTDPVVVHNTPWQPA